MKKTLLVVGFALAFSAQGETIEDALQACTQQDNALKRLVCYDKITKSLNQYSGTDKALEIGQPIAPIETNVNHSPVSAQAPQEHSDFGLERQKALENVNDKLTSAVANVMADPYGKLTVTLNNGQVWKQSDSTRIKLDSGDTVTVERAALGSFMLSKEGQNKRIRVKRVK